MLIYLHSIYNGKRFNDVASLRDNRYVIICCHGVSPQAEILRRREP